MWVDLETGFQIAFENAWEAYKNNTIPIGVAILDENSILVATGHNQVHSDGNGLIKFHQLAHAEVNAILKLSEITDPKIHRSIRKFTLYSTMEPCPFCFGAIVMGSIRKLKFAARDSWAGATALNNTIDYIKSKKISVDGPYDELEMVQIAMSTCFELEQGSHTDILLESWSNFCNKGVRIGEILFKEHILKDMAAKQFSEVYDYICKIGGWM